MISTRIMITKGTTITTLSAITISSLEKWKCTNMPRKNDTRKRALWINIKLKVLRGPRPSPKVVRDTLIESIIRGDYLYPRDWYVRIEWRNKAFVDMRSGEFGQEMRA